MIKFQEIKFNNPGVLIADVPKDIWNILCNSIDITINSKEKLSALKFFKLGVSGIKESLKFTCPTEFKTFIFDFTKEYYNYFTGEKVKSIDITGTWLNLQKKSEYRPLHSHPNNISFIVWYKIPYNLKNEDLYENSFPTNVMPNGRFQFVVNSLTGNPIIHLLETDSSYEGKIIIFNSKILHGIFPFFTSDEYRISLAGNANVTLLD